MHFKIDKIKLLNSLNIVSRAISNYSPLPAFSGIKFDVSDNEICLTGSDSDISIRTYLNQNEDNNLTIIKTGSIVIESKYILDIIRKIDTDIIEIEVLDGCTTKICGGNSEYNIIGMYPNDYPNLDFSKCEDEFKIESSKLKQIISQTLFATSDKDNRPVLTGLNFVSKEHKLIVTGTDSYRLARKEIDVDNDLNFNITIPAKSLSEVMKSLDSSNEVLIGISLKKVQFIFEDTLIQTRLIDGKYPDTDRLIPTEFKSELLLDVKDALGSIDRLSFIKNDGISIIKLSLDNNECVLSSKSQEIGYATEILKSGEYHGSTMEISFNGKYVFDSIKALNDSQIVFKFSGEMSAFIIVGKSDESSIQLVLPVRTYA